MVLAVSCSIWICLIWIVIDFPSSGAMPSCSWRVILPSLANGADLISEVFGTNKKHSSKYHSIALSDTQPAGPGRSSAFYQNCCVDLWSNLAQVRRESLV